MTTDKSKQAPHDGIAPDGLSKEQQLHQFQARPDGEFLTTNQGVRIPHTDDSLKAGERGPTLMEDFHFREKITHFDHERIPERVVHARGSGAHGYFQVYESMAEYTKAAFLLDPAKQTPVFVRFSTVLGSRGSADTVRDVRGFATKFYTEEGVYDLVGNNIPVFFIQDAIKFPDIIHAGKPEPHHEMPQAATAHDTFWDFISLDARKHARDHVGAFRSRNSAQLPHDGGIRRPHIQVCERRRARPASSSSTGSRCWASIRWCGTKRSNWLARTRTTTVATSGKPFSKATIPNMSLESRSSRRQDEFKFPFDILDATKLWPEELVPVRRIGKMTLNRNPENFFAETEQVAFHTGHLVPGIDVTDDPLLQGRLFSYLDTQLLATGWTQLCRDSDQQVNRDCSQQPARRFPPLPDRPWPDQLLPQFAWARLPGARARVGGRLRPPSASRLTAPRSAGAVKASKTISVRRSCFSTACRRPRSST